MDTGQWIVIGLSIFLGAWYVVGATVNRRRGIATYHWLRAGLETVGKVTEARWIGSSGSGARLAVGRANKPFGRVEVVFLLDSREILPLWLINLLRGKRDEMILKANLRSVPAQEVEAARSGDREIRNLLTDGQGSAFEQVPSPQGFDVIQRGRGGEGRHAALNTFLEEYGEAVRRLSLRRGMPHLIVRVDLTALREREVEEFFTALQSWV